MHRNICKLVSASVMSLGLVAACLPAISAVGSESTKPRGAKDLFFRQLQNPTQLTKAPGTAPSPDIKSVGSHMSNFGLQYTIELVRDGRTLPVDSQFPFRSGDQIRFKIISNIDGHMFINLKSGSSGKSMMLYPIDGEDNHVSKGVIYEFPTAEQGVIEFDNKAGLEQVQLTLSPTQIPWNSTEHSRTVTVRSKGERVTIDKQLLADLPHISPGGQADKHDAATVVSTDTTRPLTINLTLKHDIPDLPGLITEATPQQKPVQNVSTSVASVGQTRNSNVELPQDASDQSANSADSPIKDKWALLIGVSQFQDPVLNLRYAAKDAQDLGKFLIDEQHFAPDHVRVLTDKNATREHILHEIDHWLKDNVKAGDLAVVYLASHGTSSEMDKAVENKNYLVAYDTKPNDLLATGIEMQSFSSLIKSRIGRNTNRIMIVLDTCHSGAAGAKSVLVVPKVNLVKDLQGTGQLLLASSSQNEVSFDSKDYNNGIFTHNLIEALRQYPDIKAAYEFLSNAVTKDSMKQFGVKQTPVFKDRDWVGPALRLGVPPSVPRQAKI